MRFEYDPAKSESNKSKHGLDFEQAQALSEDPFMLVAPARTVDESCYLAVGMLAGRHWSAVYAKRDNVVRIISVRCSRAKEVQYYEGC